MASMSTPSGQHRARWFRSFYFRIGFSFVVFVGVVLVAQSVLFRLIGARSLDPFPNRSPNNRAAMVAADVGSALAHDYLIREYGR